MSYDINFWRQPAGYNVEPEETYGRLCDGEEPDELIELPVDDILRDLKSILPDFEPSDEFPLAHSKSQEANQDGSVELSWGKKHFRFDLRGEWTEAYNEIVALMARYECPLYDPQAEKRYATKDGTGVAEVPREEPLTAEQKAEVQKIKEQFLAGISGPQQKRGCGSSVLLVLLFLSAAVAASAVA